MHLRILRSAGLVSERRDGRFRFYSLNPAPADEAVRFLQGLFRTSLSGLKVAAEAVPAKKAGSHAARPTRRKWASFS